MKSIADCIFAQSRDESATNDVAVAASGLLPPVVRSRASLLGSSVGTKVVRSFQVGSVEQGIRGLQD